VARERGFGGSPARYLCGLRECRLRIAWQDDRAAGYKLKARLVYDHYAAKIASPGNKTKLSTICPNLRDIGLWFTARFVFVEGDSILQPRSYLAFTGATTKDLKNGWFEIKKEFVPTANSTILIVGALNFLPVLTLGPVVEHFLNFQGKLF